MQVLLATGQVVELPEGTALPEGATLLNAPQPAAPAAPIQPDPNAPVVGTLLDAEAIMRAKKWFLPSNKTFIIPPAQLPLVKVCKVTHTQRNGANGPYMTVDLLLNEETYNLDPLTTNMVANMELKDIKINVSSIVLTVWNPTQNHINPNAQSKMRASFELLDN